MCIKFSSNSHTEWDDLFQSKTVLLPEQYLLYFDNGIHTKHQTGPLLVHLWLAPFLKFS